MTYLTEKEAREKWCPFARVPGRVSGRDKPDEPERTLGYTSQNRGLAMGGALDNCRCIASDCMAWGWVDVYATAVNPESPAFKKLKGYCGLSRKPEAG